MRPEGVNTPISGSLISSISVKPASKPLRGSRIDKTGSAPHPVEAPIASSGKTADWRASLVSAALS